MVWPPFSCPENPASLDSSISTGLGSGGFLLTLLLSPYHWLTEASPKEVERWLIYSSTTTEPLWVPGSVLALGSQSRSGPCACSPVARGLAGDVTGTMGHRAYGSGAEQGSRTGCPDTRVSVEIHREQDGYDPGSPPSQRAELHAGRAKRGGLCRTPGL